MVMKAKKPESVHLYVEGGGDQAVLHDELRRGFRAFLLKAGCRGNMPRIVACGGRNQAFDSFQTALNTGDKAVLLVDSEELVDVAFQSAWKHFEEREGDKHSL